MNNEQKNPPPRPSEETDAIKRNRIAQKRKSQLDNNMPLYIIFGAVVSLLIFGVITLIIVFNFNKNDPSKKLSKDDYIYKIGSTRFEVAYKDANRNGILYINMNEVSKVCGLTVSGDSKYLKITSPNGQHMYFSNDSKIAFINGYEVIMNSPATIENNVCHIPLDFLKNVTVGIEIQVDNVLNVVKIIRTETENSTKSNPEYVTVEFLAKTISPILPDVHFSASLDSYEVYMNPTNYQDFLTLVNKANPLGETYVPSDLTTIDIQYCAKEIEMTHYAAKALEAMMIEMHTAGYTNILVTSGYRSYAYQKQTFDGHVATARADPKNSALTDEEIIALVNQYSAKEGYSEHQSGLCADLVDKNKGVLDESFANYPVYIWLGENAWKFGFIERYPQDKTDITGYDYEPWHYRYVGRRVAYEIHSKDICLEEYLETKNK